MSPPDSAPADFWSTFTVFPAIDLRGGRCVRLLRGNFAQETSYSDTPGAQAAEFSQAGAEWIHVVDLDAARLKTPSHATAKEKSKLPNLASIAEICESSGAKVQAGGGVRSLESAKQLKQAGVARVVVGTAAVENSDLLGEIAEIMPVALGLDARDGKVATHGWERQSDLSVLELLDQLQPVPLDAVIITDIHRDGTQQGPNLVDYKTILSQTDFPVIASGGVGNEKDVRKLAKLRADRTAGVTGNTRSTVAGLAGVIIGRALYEAKIDLAHLLRAVI